MNYQIKKLIIREYKIRVIEKGGNFFCYGPDLEKVQGVSIAKLEKLIQSYGRDWKLNESSGVVATDELEN